MKVKIEKFETYPAGVYDVRVTAVAFETESTYGEQFRFKFEIVGGELNGKTLTAWCSYSGSVKSKFYEWYSALTGRAPQAGEEVDTEELTGKMAQGVLKVLTKDDGTQKNKLESLLPYKPPANTQTTRPVFPTPQDAIEYAHANGFADATLETLKAALMATGATGWNKVRDSAWLLDVYLPSLLEVEAAF